MEDARTLAADMVGVAHAGDVGVEGLELRLGVLRAHGHRLGDLLVHNHVDLHALLGLALQHAVKAPFRMVRRGAAEEELGREPPVLSKVLAWCVQAVGWRQIGKAERWWMEGAVEQALVHAYMPCGAHIRTLGVNSAITTPFLMQRAEPPECRRDICL